MGAVTVREVLSLPAFRGTTLLAGSGGAARIVSGVNVMEVPDIESFVKGGELLLTTAYPLREHPEQLGDLVTALDRLGVAALAVKPGRYLDEIPADMIAVAERLDFPLLTLPGETSFNEVIGALLSVVLTEYGADPGAAEAIRERLTGVALSGGGLAEIARTLAGSIERSVAIVDTDGVVLGYGGSIPADVETMPWSFAVSVAGGERGRILVDGAEEPGLGDRRLIRQACFAAGMHVAQALASIDLDRHMRVLYLEDLVTGKTTDDALVRERYRLFGWDFSASHVVLLARCELELADVAVSAAAESSLGVGAVAWTRGHEVVALVPQRPGAEQLTAVAARWYERLLRLGAGVATVAVGPRAEGAAGFVESHRAARESLAVATATRQSVVAHDDLALERLLLALPRERLVAIVDEQLGPLLSSEAETQGDLCHTLEVFLGLGNAAEAARRLFIHYNTIKHRLRRISEILSADLHDPHTRLALAVALRARTLTEG